MSFRSQRTIARPVSVTGFGFFSGVDVEVTFRPAAIDHGIQFIRVDRPGSKPIPALVDYVVTRPRRTALQRGDVSVEMTEHVLAALAGLRVDNCAIEINAAEPPGCDGSSAAFVEALLFAGAIEQAAPRKCLRIRTPVRLDVNDGAFGSGGQSIVALPNEPGDDSFTIEYELDYGADSAIARQTASCTLTTESFVNDISEARTFVLEEEVAALRQAGYGKRVTSADLLIYGRTETGASRVIDNAP